MKEKQPREEQALYDALMTLKSKDEMQRFLADLCTPGEITAFAERWAIARMLNEGNDGYREIAAATGASTTTVARVARFLRQESYQGYKIALKRLGLLK
ncbi:MAG: YerC/YecD family TrpR-related protein [Pseudomonadota bacterium]